MQLPENVVPMPAQMRAELKRLAEAATSGPWRAVPWMGVPAAEDGTWPTPDKSQWRTRIGVEQSAGDEKERSSVFYGDSTPWGSGASLNDAEYIAAVSPDVALATLAYVEVLEAENAKLAARAAGLQAELAEQRGQVTSLLEDLANGCVPVRGEAGKATTPYWLAVNSERARTLAWAELKCKELGISWPIKPIPYAGNLPSAPPPSSPAAAGLGEPVWVSVADRLPEGRVKVRTAEGYEALVAVHETDQGQRYVTCVEWDNPNFSFGLVVGKVVEWCEESAAATTTGEGKGGAPC